MAVRYKLLTYLNLSTLMWPWFITVPGPHDQFHFLFLHLSTGVLRGLVVKCLTHNPVVLGSNNTGSSGFSVSLGKTLQSPSLVLEKPRKDMNNVNCCRDMTEILLKAA